MPGISLLEERKESPGSLYLEPLHGNEGASKKGLLWSEKEEEAAEEPNVAVAGQYVWAKHGQVTDPQYSDAPTHVMAGKPGPAPAGIPLLVQPKGGLWSSLPSPATLRRHWHTSAASDSNLPPLPPSPVNASYVTYISEDDWQCCAG